MNDLHVLGLVLLGLYLWESAFWLPHGALAFLFGYGRGWRIRFPSRLLGSQRGGFGLAFPLPPLGTVLTASPYPLSLSSGAVLAYVPFALGDWRPAQTARFIPFQQIRQVEARGRQVRVNGEIFLRAHSPRAAWELARHLDELTGLPGPERRGRIEEIFQGRFDTDALRRRWQSFAVRARPLRWWANGLFAYLFILCPLLASRVGLKPTWPFLLAGLGGLTLIISLQARRLHHAFYPAQDEERFSLSLTLLLSPPSAVRALDALSKPLLHAFDALALARVFCSDHHFRELARAVLLDVRMPARPHCPATEPQALETETESRQTLRRILEEFLRREGLDPEQLAGPPARSDEAALAYCPRCQAQYAIREGCCADCGGLPLQPFPAGCEQADAACLRTDRH